MRERERGREGLKVQLVWQTGVALHGMVWHGMARLCKAEAAGKPITRMKEDTREKKCIARQVRAVSDAISNHDEWEKLTDEVFLRNISKAFGELSGVHRSLSCRLSTQLDDTHLLTNSLPTH